MKKLFLFLAMVGLVAISCEGGLDNEENGGNTSTPKIELSRQTIEVDFEPNTYTVSVTSPYSWKAESDNEWIVVESKTGIAGTEELSFRVECNYEKKERKGTILLTNSAFDLATELYVTQNGLSEEEYAKRRCIFYTSSDGEVITPYKTAFFGANIVSNTYENGKGVIKFDAPVTEIGGSAFRGCSCLTSITIPDSVTEIGESAFIDCSSLTSITIPDSVTTIGIGAFARCSSLTSITIPDSVTEIGQSAFNDCSSLTSITIPDGVTKIGLAAFHGCSSLTSITIPDSVTEIGRGAFRECSSLEKFYGKFASADNRCLIIDGVLNSFAPAGLTSYTIPDSVTEIGDYAFSGCSSLTSITIPDSVTEIGAGAFYYCSSLTSITIPDSVTEIGWGAFWGCSSLTSVYCKATTPPTGGSNMFNYNASSRKIYVPAASVDAYKAADYWKDYASYIVGYNF